MSQLSFLDRSNERSRLRRALSSRQGTLCCLYGRRRCGKSRLLREVLPRQRSAYHVSDEREPTLQRAALAATVARLIPGFDQVTYPDWDSLFGRWWQDAPSASVLALDEFPYLAQSSPEVPSILQRRIDRQGAKGIHLVLAGSSQRMMMGLVLDSTAPLYGRAREILHIRPLGAAWIGKALRLSHPVDLLAAYSIWGGIPRYWELSADWPSPWEAAKHLVLDPLGVLHEEPRRLLLDDLRETAQATSMLSLIGHGCHRMSEVAARLGKPASSLTRPLSRLLDLGLIHRERPFGASDKDSKKALYKLEDPFLAFWFRFVEPNRSRLEAGQLKSVAREIERKIGQHRAEVWEQLARRSIAHLSIEGRRWQPARRWWGPGHDRKPMEIDLVSESVDGEALLLGEAKLSADPREWEDAELELEAKAKRLPLASSYSTIVKKVFAVDATKFRRKGLISAKDVFPVLK